MVPNIYIMLYTTPAVYLSDQYSRSLVNKAAQVHDAP